MQTLYRQSYDGILLRCLSHKQAQEALKEVHDGMWGAHQPGPKVWDRLRRLGYYSIKMVLNAITYATWCHACQFHGDFVHQAPRHLHLTSSSWPIEMWGMDVIGPIHPPTSRGHRFMAIMDYFLKWAEVVPLKEVKTLNVIKFIKHHVLYRFGVPRRIVYDNGPQFVSQAFQSSVINLESKVCHQRHTIQPLMVSQKPSTRLFESFSRSLSRKVNVTWTTN